MPLQQLFLSRDMTELLYSPSWNSIAIGLRSKSELFEFFHLIKLEEGQEKDTYCL